LKPLHPWDGFAIRGKSLDELGWITSPTGRRLQLDVRCSAFFVAVRLWRMSMSEPFLTIRAGFFGDVDAFTLSTHLRRTKRTVESRKTENADVRNANVRFLDKEF